MPELRVFKLTQTNQQTGGHTNTRPREESREERHELVTMSERQRLAFALVLATAGVWGLAQSSSPEEELNAPSSRPIDVKAHENVIEHKLSMKAVGVFSSSLCGRVRARWWNEGESAFACVPPQTERSATNLLSWELRIAVGEDEFPLYARLTQDCGATLTHG